MMMKDRKYILKVKGYKRKYKYAVEEEYYTFKSLGRDVYIYNTNARAKAEVYTYEELKSEAYNSDSNYFQYFDAEDIKTGELFTIKQKVINKSKMFADNPTYKSFVRINKKLNNFKSKLTNRVSHKIERGYYNKTFSNSQYIVYRWREKVKGRFIQSKD